MANTVSKIIEGQFADFAMKKTNPKYEISTSRVNTIYKKTDDIRSPFERDYHRILYSNAYRRLKHKTQVFFATNNDHICTRIEHVNYVASASETLTKCLGLNIELVRAIATGHDLGHSPFGHTGEGILKNIIIEKNIGTNFWHEKNSLRFVDLIETLPDYEGYERNLNLTYAIRDGIICHCGEVVDNGLKPREEFIDLNSIENANQYQSYTYEGLVVKIADKIAYLGRDIEDALSKKILTEEQKNEFEAIIKDLFGQKKLTDINTTTLVHLFTIDLCKNSNPDIGLSFSREYFEIMNLIKDFNYQNIYNHKRLTTFHAYAKLILQTIADTLFSYYDGENSVYKIKCDEIFYPLLCSTFSDWLLKYSNTISSEEKKNKKFLNQTIYDINSQKDYNIAVIDFISGMTDSFAIKMFNEIITF